MYDLKPNSEHFSLKPVIVSGYSKISVVINCSRKSFTGDKRYVCVFKAVNLLSYCVIGVGI